MKFKFISICLSIMVILAPIQTYAGDTTGLEAAWLLDEASGTRFDETANSNDLTDNNTVTQSTGSECGFSPCAHFEKANTEYLSITDAAQVGLDITGSFTLGAYVKVEGSAFTTRWIINKSVGGSGYGLNMSNLTNRDIRVEINNGITICLSTNQISLDTLTHVVGVYDTAANTIDIYFDGSVDKQCTSITSDPNAGSLEVTVGTRVDSNGYWDGEIDEAFIFSRALSDTEVNDIKDNGLTAFISGTARRRIIIFLALYMSGITAHYTGQAHRINEHRLKFGIERPHWMHLFDAIVNFKWIPSALAAEDFGSVNRERDNRYIQVIRNRNRQVDVYDGPKGTGYIITLYKTINEDEYRIQKHIGPEQRALATEWTKIEEKV